ncbi:MAG: NB-ARC domain-containing protein [Caldilineaceae bacterium]
MTADLTSITQELPAVELPPEDVRRALGGWHNGGVADAIGHRLYLFQRAQAPGGERHAHNRILQQGLEQLAQTHAESARILQLRFLDNWTAEAVANQLNLAPATFYERQKIAIGQMTAILCDMDMTARRERYIVLEQKLMRPQSNHLIGIRERVDELCTQLAHPDESWIISIEGIGGIGKTTLAGETARSAIRHDTSWENLAWITVRRTEFMASDAVENKSILTVGQLLEQLYVQLVAPTPPPSMDNAQLLATLEHYVRHHKCLIVIDNLERLADIELLLPTLRRLIRPSKFILTSRHSFYAEGDVFHAALDELSQENALALVRAEARSTNLPTVATTADAQLLPIYETAGGNPLALRLIVGQLHVFGLHQVLMDLKEVRSQSAEKLYTFIFRRAWDHLSEAARCLFVAMIFTTPDGDTLEELTELCRGEGPDATLTSADLRSGLTQLVTLNLVESRGDLFERRFTIHNLTRSFLHKQVKLWQEPSP